MRKKIIHFFDRLEDKTRAHLSRMPILYAFFGAIGVILFWRGIWHLADDISLGSLLSALIGGLILLITGVFVSAFIGSRLIISGLSGEEKLTIDEFESESEKLRKIQNTLQKVEKELVEIEEEIRD